MNYELVKPGNGHEYPFVWSFTDDIKGYPVKGLIYISLDNGFYTSYSFSQDVPIGQVMEKCQCDANVANIIKHFIGTKFKEREVKSVPIPPRN